MVATAYTPYCSGCSGITATGRPAGHGIVAVDPRVIPLGTRLYTFPGMATQSPATPAAQLLAIASISVTLHIVMQFNSDGGR